LLLSNPPVNGGSGCTHPSFWPPLSVSARLLPLLPHHSSALAHVHPRSDAMTLRIAHQEALRQIDVRFRKHTDFGLLPQRGDYLLHGAPLAYNKMNSEQRMIYDTILHVVTHTSLHSTTPHPIAPQHPWCPPLSRLNLALTVWDHCQSKWQAPWFFVHPSISTQLR
jgi:hypothetical protein